MNTQAFSVAVQCNEPVIFWGDPGIGKSSFIESLGKGLGVYVETVIAAIREPADFGGYPAVVNAKSDLWQELIRQVTSHAFKNIGTDATTEQIVAQLTYEWDAIEKEMQKHETHAELQFLPAPFIKRVIDNCDPNKPIGAILFLDEISTAPPAVQSALLRLVLDRYAGDVKLPDNIAIVAAANPPEIAAGGWEISPPLANRFIHLDANVQFRKWSAGIIQGFPTPVVEPLNEGWEKKKSEKLALVTAYLQRDQNNFHRPPKADEENAPMAYPTPRSWEKVAKLMAACDGYASEDTQRELIAGTVGPGVAGALLEYMNNVQLPDPEAIISKKEKLVLPDRGDIAFAILNSIAVAILQNNTPERWVRGCEIVGEAIDQNLPDVAAVMALTLVGNKPEGAQVPAVFGKMGPLIIKAGLAG